MIAQGRDNMRRALALRPLTGGEIRQLKVGRCSAKGMTVRRSQILLASAAGHSPTQIASVVGCNPSTVTHVISDFHDRGIVSVHEERRQPGARRRGRLRIEEREPGITVALEQLLADASASSAVTVHCLPDSAAFRRLTSDLSCSSSLSRFRAASHAAASHRLETPSVPFGRWPHRVGQ